MREGSVRKRRKGCGGTRTYGVCWCSPGLVMSVEEGSRTPSKYHGSFLALSLSLATATLALPSCTLPYTDADKLV